MSTFAWLSFSASVTSSLLGIFIYLSSRKELPNRLLAQVLLINGYLAFVGFMLTQAENSETAYFWSKMYSLWPFLITSVFHFTLAFTGNNLLKNRFSYLLLYGPPLIFFLVDLNTNLISVPPVSSAFWGYDYTTALGSWVLTASIAWFFLLSLLSLALFWRFYHSVSDSKKPQVKFMLMGVSVPVVLAICINSLYPFLNIDIPRVGHIVTSFFSIFIAYAIWKYEALRLSPDTIAESIILAMPDPLVIADFDNKIVRVNAAFKDFFGYRGDELVGQPLGFLSSDKIFLNAIEELKQNGSVHNLELTFKTKTGEEKTAAFSGSIVRSKRGNNLVVTCIFHDLTYRKQIEAQLVKSEKFAAIGELAGMIGHDLRNPLTSIRAATYYIKLKYAGKLDDEGEEIFETINRSIDYSSKIVDDLLDYSREVKLILESTTPKGLLTNALSVLKKPSNITVIDLTEETPIVTVDAHKMSRVFVNIIKNAFDAMPDGGTLTVKSQVCYANLKFSFTDTGVGMSQETLSKLWTPLFTTKAKGMGFGLSICKRIVQAHHGEILAESTVGKGTTIIITIPLDMSFIVVKGVNSEINSPILHSDNR
ncbi:MAG: ATP-binding protein [Candidatus Bathyarchaeota archaeon]|nr:ATP-binding protein [Candidatus Bathyarchaeota archaeon]